MENSVNKKFTKKNALIVILAILCVLAFLIIYPSYQSHGGFRNKHQTLSIGKVNLEKIIEYQDATYQNNGKYYAIMPNDDLAKIVDGFKTCTSNCLPCEYASVVFHNSFTVTTKCSTNNGTSSYLGYVRVPPGEHTGIDGYYKKCLAHGIYAGKRHLINDVGPCYEQSYEIMSVASGNKKSLVIKTYPPNASVSVNGNHIGETSSSHNTISPNYGSFFWADPYAEPTRISISKPGYETLKFPLEWGSFTYTATVVLRPIDNDSNTRSTVHNHQIHPTQKPRG